MRGYYVYAFIDPRNNTPRYIGKGRGYRINWWKHYNGDSQYGVGPWLQELKALKLRPVVLVVVGGLTEAEAHLWEKGLISLIGRGENGPLLNLTDGGEGSAGLRCSAETKRKISEAQAGIPRTPHTEQTCTKISAATSARHYKRFLSSIDPEAFNNLSKEQAEILTVADVARILRVKDDTVTGWLASGWLRAFNIGNGTRRPRYRIARADLDQLLTERNRQTDQAEQAPAVF